MAKSFYRFRSVDALVGNYDELGTQSIYFASPDELNDPMEGFKDIYWSGELIVWNNLIRHYLFCLERACSIFILSGDTRQLSKDDVFVFSDINIFPTKSYEEMFLEICANYFSIDGIDTYIKKLPTRTTPVRRDELLFHLTSLHGVAVETIFKTYEKKGLIPKEQAKHLKFSEGLDFLTETDFIGTLEQALLEHNDPSKLETTLFSAQRSISSQISLINSMERASSTLSFNQTFILNSFAEVYINQIEQLLYPEWYTACFMSECSNSSVWGHYGDNHSGICLKFKAETTDEGDYLTLKATDQSIKLKFEKVSYEASFEEIDFFRSMGRLSKKVLMDTWFTNEEGDVSCYAGDIFESEESWRTEYWERGLKIKQVKSKDWKYENEHRLILQSTLDSYSEQKNRVLKYDFNSLEGLIFGIKTSKEDKLKIMKVVAEKCSETKRKDFKFYQAQYCHTTNSINYTEMGLIKFKSGAK